MINKENYLQNIPQELRQYKQWLWFKRIVKVDKWGKEKISKIPISPITFKSDSWNNRKHWTDFETAVKNLESSGSDGLSFALSKDDPFVCIDLDRVDDSFGDFLNDFNDTYREVSQSGRGIHIFAKGVITKNFNNQIEKVEMYQENKCIAMTGNIQRLGSMPVRTIKPKQKELDKYYKLFAPKDSIKEAIRNYQMMDDRVPNSNKVIEIMCRHNARAKALSEGSNTSGDPSKDDFVLLLFLNSFTHGNAEMMKEIFLRSALNRMGDKSKRRMEAGYLRYLDESIRKVLMEAIKDTGIITITEKKEDIRLNNWLKFDDEKLNDYLNRELEITEKGQVKSTTTNLITVLVNPCFCKEREILSGYIFFDTCSMTIQFYGRLRGEKSSDLKIRKWNDHMTNILGVEIEREFGIKYSKSRMEDAITFVAHKRTINLTAMYLKSLTYDGKEYILKLLSKYLGAEETELNSWIMKHILVGMVKRVFHPGCKFDELMVLTGSQGVGKTSSIEKLALFPEWYCSLNNIKGKDTVSNLVGKVVVELEEFVALRNAKSADEAKLFISARTSTARIPYERFSRDVKRTCILIATTNDATFLGDFSGERRYLPVKVDMEKIQMPLMYDLEKFPVLETITRKEHEEMVRNDFEGAIAEAVYLYDNKLHDLYLPKELRNDLNLVIQTHKS